MLPAPQPGWPTGLHLGHDGTRPRLHQKGTLLFALLPPSLCKNALAQVGCKPDFGDPVVLSQDRGGTTVEHLCHQIHNSLVRLVVE